MAVELNSVHSREGLTFDAGNVKVCSRYTDELAAYRSRKNWKEVLNSYFLLDESRDYKVEINPVELENSKEFEVVCHFNSACGRYAFWRLVNHQAPEAEQRLNIKVREKKSTIFSKNIKNTAQTENINNTRPRKATDIIIQHLVELFK